MSRPKVLAVVHSDADPAGTLGVLHAELTARAELTIQYVGDPFPDVESVDLVVAMGSAASAYDDSVPWLAGELDFLRAAAERRAVLGICFGAQALARALGGTVYKHESGEAGWHTVDTRDPGLIAPGPWFQHHFDVFTTPPDATELARSEVGSQAFRVGRSLAVQFHPEISQGALDAWSAGRPGAARPFERFEPGLAEQVARTRPQVLTLFDRFWHDIAALGTRTS